MISQICHFQSPWITYVKLSIFSWLMVGFWNAIKILLEAHPGVMAIIFPLTGDEWIVLFASTFPPRPPQCWHLVAAALCYQSMVKLGRSPICRQKTDWWWHGVIVTSQRRHRVTNHPQTTSKAVADTLLLIQGRHVISGMSGCIL